MSALSDRVAFKRRLLERRTSASVVVIGTSRFNDGLDVPAGGFNASIPSSSLSFLETTAALAIDRGDVKRLIVELSTSQVHDAEPEAVTSEAPPWAWFALVRQRRAFRVEQWSRLPAIVRSDAYDGTEFFRSRWLSESLRLAAPVEVLTPNVVCPAESTVTPVAEVYRRIAERARSRNVELVIVAPPVDSALRHDECAALTELSAAVATATRFPVFSFACIETPDDEFNDGLHLTARGRARFTASVERLHVAAACP